MAVTDTRGDVEPWERIASLVSEAVTTAGSEFHSGLLAGELAQRIRHEQPDLWDTWTATIALDQLKLAIGRSRHAARRANSTFARRGYSLTEEVDASHTIRQIGDMIRSDLDYVARSYGKRANTHRLRAQRFAALRDRLPDDTTRVRDCIPEDDIEAIYT